MSGLFSRWQDDPLSALLGADTGARFLPTIFEQDYCRSVGEQADRFAGLVTLADVDRIITGTDLKEGDIMLANAAATDGGPDGYVDGGGYIDRGAVARHYRRGATVIVNQAQRFFPALGQLCQGLEHVFSCHVQTNLYLTPPGEQGFRTHFDNHDVFVIQVEGAKQWRLYGVPLDLPFRGERYRSADHAAGDLREEFPLNAGDSLYVPRGMMHDASTLGDVPSLHITVGLINKTWADLMLEAVAEASLRLPELRRSLPAGFARTGFDRAQARATLASLGQLLAGELRLDPALDLLTDEFIRTRPALNFGALVDRDRPIAPDERLVRVSLAACRMAEDGEALALIVPGGELSFTPESGPALAKALTGEEFTLASLGFDHGEALVRRLLDYGLVKRV